MGVQPLTTEISITPEQDLPRVTGKNGAPRTLEPQGGAEEGRQDMGRVISGI